MVNAQFTGLSDAHIRSIGRDQRGGKLSRLSYQQAIERIGMSPCQPVDVFGVEWQSLYLQTVAMILRFIPGMTCDLSPDLNRTMRSVGSDPAGAVP